MAEDEDIVLDEPCADCGGRVVARKSFGRLWSVCEGCSPLQKVDFIGMGGTGMPAMPLKYPYQPFEMTETEEGHPWEDASPAEILADMNRMAREVMALLKTSVLVARRCVCSDEDRQLSDVQMYPEGVEPWWFCEACNGAYAPNHESVER
jgi:hypothetical protein